MEEPRAAGSEGPCLEIGRIHMGNNAGLALEILKGLLRRYDPVHGVIYVVVFTH